MSVLKSLFSGLLALTTVTCGLAQEPADEYQAAARVMQVDQIEQRMAATQRAAEARSESQQLLRHSQELEQHELQASRQLGQQQRQQLLEADGQRLQRQAAKNQIDAAAGRQRLQMLQMSSRAALQAAQAQFLKSLQQHGANLADWSQSHSTLAADKDVGSTSPGDRPKPRSSTSPIDPSALPRRPVKQPDAPASEVRQLVTDSDSARTLAQMASFLGGSDSDLCKELARKINDAIYRDKNAAISRGGIHGLWHRLREQVSGKHGPGTPEWDGHTEAFENQQRHLRDLLDQFATNFCGQPPRIARQIASRPAPAPSEWRGTTRLNVLQAPSTTACKALGGLAALSTGLAACTTDGAAGVLVCSPLAEVPIIPVGCGIAACTKGAILSATATFALTERACSAWMSGHK